MSLFSRFKMSLNTSHKAAAEPRSVSKITTVAVAPATLIDQIQAASRTNADSAPHHRRFGVLARFGPQRTRPATPTYNDCSPPPASISSKLTHAGLQNWQNEAGLNNAEYEERRWVAEKILRATAPGHTRGRQVDHLEVLGDLELFGLCALTRLPEGLSVRGNLYCRGCTGLTQLPENMHVGGNLDCSDCSGLTHLPKGLNVSGNLRCCDCSALTQLAEAMHVGGNLNCSGCTSLTHLPDGLSVVGNLDCNRCSALIQLPEGLRVSGNLSCRLCTSLTQLPAGLEVGANIDCGHCSQLTHLPEGLKVSGDLRCSSCTSLTQLPDNLDVSGSLDCSGCHGLTHLPKRLNVGGSLDCSFCYGLTQLPKWLNIRGNLFCEECTGMTELPEVLTVGGRFNCRNCSGLTQLPAALKIGEDLDCYGCTRLTQLPEGMAIRGDISLKYCRRLTCLPNDFTELGCRANGRVRTVELTGSGITGSVLLRLRQAEAPGMQFFFSTPSEIQNTTHFSNLDEATRFWQSQAFKRDVAVHSSAALDLPHSDRDQLQQFLERLRETAEYKHPQARTRLAGRVCDLLEAMHENANLSRLCSDCIGDALQTCSDRVIWAMNQAETAVRAHQAQQNSHDGAALKALVLSFLRLDIVQAHARRKVTSLRWVDEIEVFLAYESGLRGALQLPVSAEHMLFASCSQVTSEDLSAAQQDSEAAMRDPERIAAYLQASSLWQHYLRQRTMARWSWTALREVLLPEHCQVQQMMCPITHNFLPDLIQPVMWQSRNSQGCVVYEAADLLKYWAEQGKEPTTKLPIALTEIQRLAKTWAAHELNAEAWATS